MNTVIIDPEDPTRAIIGSAAEATLGVQIGDAVIGNIHDRARCAGRACVIHAPSDHHMREWSLNWRDDRGLMERICPAHGVGHPDPDQLEFFISIGQESQFIHGCCGCC